MNETPFKTFFTLVSRATALYSYNYLGTISLELLFRIILAAVIGSVIYRVQSFLFLEFPIRFRWFRKLFDKRSVIEGKWRQIIPQLENSPLSIAHIYFEPNERVYVFRGANYQKKQADEISLVKLATWKSSRTDINLKSETMEFSYNAEIVRPTQNRANTIGLGIIRFEIRGDSCNEGTGHFNDSTTDQRNYNFDIYRITDLEIEELIDKKGKFSSEDWEKLAEAVYKKYNL
jgi:hypothetical protein